MNGISLQSQITRKISRRARRCLHPCFPLLLTDLLRQLIADVIFKYIAYVRRRLDPDFLRCHKLNVVEPLVRIQSAAGRQLAHPRDTAWPGVVTGKREERTIRLAKAWVFEISGHQSVHVLGATVNIGFDYVDVSNL